MTYITSTVYPSRRLLLLPVLLLLPWVPQARAYDTIFHGKVVRDDGATLGHLVVIERVCSGADRPVHEGVASAKTGEYFVRLDVDPFAQILAADMTPVACRLEAYDHGFVSTSIDLTNKQILNNPRLPDIVLSPATHTNVLASERDPNVPRAASRSWNQATDLILARNWTAAEAPMRAVVEKAPTFAAGWSGLGILYSNLDKPDEARPALERAIGLDPKPLFPYMCLTAVEVRQKDWEAAQTTAQTLIAVDKKHTYIEANLMLSIALYQQRQFDNALIAVTEAIRLDKLHQLPRAQYVQGLILEAKGDLEGAGQRLRDYIAQHPRAKDIATVNERLANLGKSPIDDLSAELSTLDLRAAAPGESPVPGGIKAFSAVAQLKDDPSYDDFFLNYSRAIVAGGPTAEAADDIRIFIATVAALESLGERKDDTTTVRLSFTTDDAVRKARDILLQSGWKLISKGDQYDLEPGDVANDGLRAWALTCLGVDEIALRQAVRQKHDFSFTIPRENARLIGGAAWGVLLKGVPDMPGGPIEVFSRDRRFPKIYLGLAGMDAETAGAIVSATGLNNLIVKDSRLLAEFGDSIVLTARKVQVPGGAAAEPAWTKLVGTKPENAAQFLRALFDKDQGRLMAFYYDVAHADLPRRQYITQTTDRAQSFYNWYRDSILPTALPPAEDRWQAAILQNVLLPSGKLSFPGGPEAWGARGDGTDEIMQRRVPGPVLVSISRLQEKRHAPFTPDAVRLLIRHESEWRNLFPSFEKLPALDAPDFAALETFAAEAQKAAPERRDMLLGDWYSLVELASLGVQSGAVSNQQAAQYFRQACEAMRAPDASARAIQILRAMAGGAADLDAALANQLLRLSGQRLEAFETIKHVQSVPSFASLEKNPTDAATLAALSGSVYAALLDPSYLLVAEDPQLLARHNFIPVDAQETIFGSSRLAVSNTPPGSHFVGGFGDFRSVSKALRKQVVGPLLPEVASLNEPFSEAATTTGISEAPPPADVVFKAGGRIVEVTATVTDWRGRYVDDLTGAQFSVQEQGAAKPVFAFENRNAPISVALLFDTTGSMTNTLPLLKAAALQLVDDLRPTDSVAVYTFSDSVNENQPLTTDKEAARRAIAQTHAAGTTALHDALVRVNRDLSTRGGKKFIIVFTDGSDNASMLTSALSIERAKANGIPIYTIAEGDAITEPQVVGELARMSKATGGSQFLIHKLGDIAPVFEKVSQELMHGYLLAFQPSPGDSHEWRTIKVVLSGGSTLQVRAREGFYVE